MNAQTTSRDCKWIDYWQKHSASIDQLDPQSQVMRTLAKIPIDDQRWERTVDHVIAQFGNLQQSTVLDLAGGNGLFAGEFATRGAHVTVVDAAKPLLQIAGKAANVTTVVADIRDVAMGDESFDYILFYAAVQYLSHAETIHMMFKLHQWLKPGGVCLIGDIPDANRRWHFFDSDERRSTYFRSLAAGQPVVGTWFERIWLENLAAHAGFSEVVSKDQPADQIYSSFRFDLRCQK